MKKIAGLEMTEVLDAKHQKNISISTTVRLIYRKISPENYGGMRNVPLNDAIAKDFASNAGNILHYFWINQEEETIGEIRGGSSGNIFISVIKGDQVAVLTIQNSWKQPRLRRKEVNEMGQE